MSYLCVYHVSTPDTPNKVLTHFDDIASTLAGQGVGFERWQAATRIEPGASQVEVTTAYQQQIDAAMTERALAAVEVLSVERYHPQKDELRAGLLDEQRQAADEVRLFVAGRGLLSLHIGDYVYAVLCERHDLISVPAGTAHWFDIGEYPEIVMVRLSKKAQATSLTGDDIASRFPRLDD